MSIRPVLEHRPAQPAIEGAGVRLHRAFGFRDPTELDPFLLFDDFRNERPEDYLRGFPWHPHRGIETITYVLAGSVEHGDSLGNRGTLGAGDLQLMTAGSGILHQEMPQGNARGQMHGFQLWANLPGHLKMTAPRYQDIKSADLPEIIDDDGTVVRVVIGRDTVHRAFPAPEAADHHPDHRAVIVDDLGQVGALDVLITRCGHLQVAGPEGVRFLLISGAPIEEPVAWHGPIVMNTQDELRQAMSDLRNGTFIRPAQ